MSSAGYIFDDALGQAELERLRLLESVFDPDTRRLLEATGAWSGRHCLEAGAGAGSIAIWMAEQAGPTGRVVALDTNVRWLQSLKPPIEVLCGDLREAALPLQGFDLVHARYVLIHNQQPESLLEALLAGLKPGGWLLLEEPDFSAARVYVGGDELVAAFERVNRAIAATFTERGMDPVLGARLPALLDGHGVELVAVEHDVPVVPGGAPLARLMDRSALHLTEKYVATERASPEDVLAYRRFAATPGRWASYYATVRVLGRAPAG